jgi:hypothetical protein
MAYSPHIERLYVTNDDPVAVEYDDVAVCSQKLSGLGPKRFKKVEKLNIAEGTKGA